MRKTLTLALAVALFAILAAVVVAQVGDEPAAGASRRRRPKRLKASRMHDHGAHDPEPTTTTAEETPEPVRTETPRRR